MNRVRHQFLKMQRFSEECFDAFACEELLNASGRYSPQRHLLTLAPDRENLASSGWTNGNFELHESSTPAYFT